MFWVGGRKQLQKIKINRWATVGKGLMIIAYCIRLFIQLIVVTIFKICSRLLFSVFLSDERLFDHFLT
jgi:hypothetical protein